MKYMVKFVTKEGQTMVLTDYGFAPEMMFAPLFLDSKVSGMVSSALSNILFYAGLTNDQINDMCIHQEAVSIICR